MKIGVIGTGNIGQVIIEKLREATYSVKMANTRGVDSMKALADQTGAVPVSLAQVVQDVDVLFLVIPTFAIAKLPAGFLNGMKKEAIVVDVSNYYPQRDGKIDEIEQGLLESAWVEKHIGHAVIKALNSIASKSLAKAGRRKGDRERVAMPIAGDDAEAKKAISALIDKLGFDPFDAGTIADSWRLQPGSRVYCTNPTLAELQSWLKDVDRAALAGHRDKSLQAFSELSPNIDYQTLVKAIRAVV